MLDADLKVSLTRLKDKIASLHTYTSLAPPSAGLPPAMTSAPEGVGIPAQAPAPAAKAAGGEAAPEDDVQPRTESGETP
jgi:hypothetical protein